MDLVLSPKSLEDYKTFLKIKSFPQYRFKGRTAQFPDSYARLLGVSVPKSKEHEYEPIKGLFDYQLAITKLAIQKRKYAVYMDCGMGKQLIAFEFARYVSEVLSKDKCVLIVCPLMVVKQAMGELRRFYGESFKVEQIAARDLALWLVGGKGRVGITNYDGLSAETPQGRLGALICDEAHTLSSSYGKWSQTCVRLGKGLEWKLALTGTPAPNDRIEFANHSVFLDRFPTINSFLAKFFINRGETANRWELKPHALRPFYRSLSDWCIFLTNPATYGWKDNVGKIPPIHVHIEDVRLTEDQKRLAPRNGFFSYQTGGITGRSMLSQLAKGNYKGTVVDTLKPQYIKDRVDSWSDSESTIIWCLFNKEQQALERLFPDAASIHGTTSLHKRETLIDDFKSGRRKVLISKGKVLGFGLNLQKATRQVFSSLVDSYLTYYQCVKRSNRVGSLLPLNVHLPVLPIERPMIDTVLSKAHRVQQDTEEQERLFKEINAEVLKCNV